MKTGLVWLNMDLFIILKLRGSQFIILSRLEELLDGGSRIS